MYKDTNLQHLTFGSWALLPVAVRCAPLSSTVPCFVHLRAVSLRPHTYAPHVSYELRVKVFLRNESLYMYILLHLYSIIFVQHAPVSSVEEHESRSLAPHATGVRAISSSAPAEDSGALQEPAIVRKQVVGATRWLQLVTLHWQDDRGRQREWHAAERPFPSAPDAPLMAPQASAVAVLPILRINGRLSEVSSK